MESSILADEDDVQAIQALIGQLGARSTVVDFDEQMCLANVRARTRLWKVAGRLVGFAFVDDFNNLWFDTESDSALAGPFGSEIVEWGEFCARSRNAEAGTDASLDHCCEASAADRIRLLARHGFAPQDVRTLRFSRSLNEPVPGHPLPPGFSIRCVRGPDEVEQLVALHRDAFGTSSMSVEQRLAMMSTPRYVRELDLLAVTPGGELAAFCVCGFYDSHRQIGYTEPIGTRPAFQRLGLARALVSNGLVGLKTFGAKSAELGTSSENLAMQQLARSLGFVLVSEKVWFSKAVK